MAAVITNHLRILNSDTFADRTVSQPTFLFIGKDDAWDDEDLPDGVSDSDADKESVFSNILAIKRIQPNSIKSVTLRYDWVSGEVYDAYDHRINMVDGRKSNGAKYVYYVLTDEFNVYKCISNNSGAPSTNKPTGTSLTQFQTPDGYIWKYMYTIRATDVFDYLTPEWMPVYTLEYNDGSSQWLVQDSSIDGGIHSIIVDNPGVGYDSDNLPIPVITGDGTGATAVCEVNATTGAIEKVIITNPGSGYTQASITLTNTGLGLGFTGTPILSPIGGHGKDCRAELGGVHKMVKITIEGDEGGYFPLTSYRQVGILYMPKSLTLGSKLTVNSSNGFSIGNTITGGTSGATGTIHQIENNGKVVWVRNVTGDFNQTETVVTNSGVSTFTSVAENDVEIPLTSVTASNTGFISRTGKILYISNRVAIFRSPSQSENIRFVIGF